MKLLKFTLALAAMAGSLWAQGIAPGVSIQTVSARGGPVAEGPSPLARSAFLIHPYARRSEPESSAFWSRSTMALVALDGAAKAADSFATRKNIDGGGVEYDVLARPFVHTMGVQVAAMAALFGAEVALAYTLHRKRHNNLARSVLIGGAVMNGLGAADSFKNGFSSW